ncbi:efflux RND transporter permease subunit [Moheibacter sediminis]|uniref:Heavy metal efflux pump, CzcA family/hydrophobe/amphiphile efflux-1 (HAE1) family protein n=1 Tax=Moheibacter sediminis TaxID=1434700 RepID=A0A1W1Z6Q7_9FLAO|nr:efflux RND transporter permease subunit [Moheibacter sediminis]SMC44085.1 heavy metal efflux pump, CzcA family/hydrophobe/amphiphile efflux-1 (HAE1) family protein [Moheibacter sediminis]
MKLAEISIKRPTLVVALFTILTLGGLFSYTQLGYELIPKFEFNMITISTVYPGASPSEMENTVTKKIEDAVASMENIKKIESKSFESLSMVMIQLNPGTDTNYALNDAQRKVNTILADLPEDADPPSLLKLSADDFPIITIAATSDMNSIEFYDLLDKKIQPILSRVPGVAQIDIIGGQEREIQVSLNQNKLEGYGLSVPQVMQMIQSSNLDFPTGNVKTRENTTLIRLSGKYQTVEELRNLVVSSNNGIQVRLSEIADVQDSQKEADKVSRLNQSNTILLQIKKQSDANAVAVSEEVRAELDKIQTDYKAQNVQLKVANDTSEMTLVAANNVMFDLFLAIFLVAAVMLLFLHSLRNAFIVMVSIPASLIATFIGIYFMGYTLNLMSLVALSLVVGILVDDAIVVLENIHRHMEMGKNKVRAAYDGASEIGFTVVAITLVIIVVFLPISISNDFVSNIIKQFAVTVMIATGFSLLASFTIVPWLSSRFGKLEHITGKNFFEKIILAFEGLLTRFTNWVSGILKWSLKAWWSKVLTIVIAVILFFSSLALVGMGFVGGEFFPKMDKGEFLVQIELPKDASLEQTNIATQKAEKYIRQKSEVVDMITTVGQLSSGFSGSQATAYQSEIQVILTDKKLRDESTFIFAAKLKRELEKELIGAKVSTIPMGIMGVEDAPLQLVVIGPSVDSAMVFAKKAEAELKKISGASEVELSVEDGNPEISVQVDRDKMSLLGLDLTTVGMTMQTAFSGNTDAKFRAGEYEYDINIRYDQFNRSNIDDVKNLIFVNNQGQQIKLSQFAEVVETSGPSGLDRRDKSPSVTVRGQSVGRPLGDVAAEWETKFSQIPKPLGVSYVWGGDMEMQSEGFGTLGIALLAAIILVYLVMVGLYNSYVYPFVVLFSIPLSLIGVMVILALTNNTLNIFTILGMIMLIGLVCKNAILLVDFANHRKEEGETTYNALVQANHARLRPILMTTIAMVCGMIPIAIASGAAAEMNNGLAWVIIGGLISSLFLTLIIVPVVYSIFDSLIRRFGKKNKIDYADEMVADYEHRELSDDGFTPKH